MTNYKLINRARRAVRGDAFLSHDLALALAHWHTRARAAHTRPYHKHYTHTRYNNSSTPHSTHLTTSHHNHITQTRFTWSVWLASWFSWASSPPNRSLRSTRSARMARSELASLAQFRGGWYSTPTCSALCACACLDPPRRKSPYSSGLYKSRSEPRPLP